MNTRISTTVGPSYLTLESQYRRNTSDTSAYNANSSISCPGSQVTKLCLHYETTRSYVIPGDNSTLCHHVLYAALHQGVAVSYKGISTNAYNPKNVRYTRSSNLELVKPLKLLFDSNNYRTEQLLH